MDTEAQLLALVDEKISEAQNLIQKCESLIVKGIDGSMKLKRKIQAEMEFLMELKKHPTKLRPNHVTSTNLTHLNALCEAALTRTDVAAVLSPYPRMDKNQSNLIVDVVADGGSTWIKVVARSAKGESKHQERGILDQAQDYVATSSKNPHLYKSPKIVFLFCAGVTQSIVDDLNRRFSIQCQGDIMAIDPSWGVPLDEELSGSSESDLDSDQDVIDEEADLGITTVCIPAETAESTGHSSEIDSDQTDAALNLDITALIAYVSNLTNGDGAQYRFRQPLLDEQAAWERQRPALPQLSKFMDPDVGRRLICCKTAHSSFMDILNTVGGDEEKKRSKELLDRVELVDDKLSDRTVKLQLGGKIKDRSKKIFGSGDYYQAITLTANRGFVHAAANQGVRLAVIFHESRALSEQKQQHAVPLHGNDKP